MLIRTATLVALASIMLSSYSNADLVVTVDSITTTDNSTVTTTVFVSDGDGAANGITELEGYNIPLDIGIGMDGDFNALPAGLSFVNPANPAVSGALFGGASYAPNINGAPFDFDGVVSFSPTVAGTTVALTSTPIELFSIAFDVAAGVADTTVFDVSVVNSVVPGSISFPGVNIGTPLTTPGALGAGTITIGTAVPEPTAAILVLAGFAGLALKRRRS